MAGKSSRKSPSQASKPFEDFDEELEGFEEDISGLDSDEGDSHQGRSRDWRDVEKLRELRELRKLVGDDLDDLLEGFDAGQPKTKKPKR